MMTGGIDAGRILGVRLRLDWSWFVVLVLLSWSFARLDFPFRAPGFSSGAYWMLGVAMSLTLFASVLIHELAHAVAARSRGIPVARITLFIFGGVAEMRMEARRPIDEFILTIAGPLASVGLAGLFAAAARGAGAAGWITTSSLAGTLAQLNLVLAVFNMLPAYPLDGGRVLRAGLWQLSGDLRFATRWATMLGRLFGWLMMAWGVWMFFVAGARLAGGWAMFLGWFLAGAAAAASRRNRGRLDESEARGAA